MAIQTRNLWLVQQLPGNTNLKTSTIYLDLVGDEARVEEI